MQHRQIRWVFKALDRNRRSGVPVLPRRTIPDHRRDPAFPPPPARRRQGRSSHIRMPRPLHHAASPMNGNGQADPCALPYSRLYDRSPARRPRPAHLPTSSDAYVVPPIPGCGVRPDRCSRRGTPPVFQASCASADTVGMNRRGTFFRHPAR